ncbi:hypothetical protein ACSBR2_012621 [Camellia fascicularis]
MNLPNPLCTGIIFHKSTELRFVKFIKFIVESDEQTVRRIFHFRLVVILNYELFEPFIDQNLKRQCLGHPAGRPPGHPAGQPPGPPTSSGFVFRFSISSLMIDGNNSDDNENTKMWTPRIETKLINMLRDEASRNVKKFRTKGFEYFQEMAEIVENCCATGALSRASTQGPLDSEEEDDMLNKFWNADAGGSNAGVLFLFQTPSSYKRLPVPTNISKSKETHLIVATLIATVNFTAGITMPGGYINDNKDPNQGMAILTRKAAFVAFVITDTIALTLSVFAVLTHLYTLTDHPTSLKKQLGLAFCHTFYALIAMLLAFITGAYAVLAPSSLSILVCVIPSILLFIYLFYIMYLLPRDIMYLLPRARHYV